METSQYQSPVRLFKVGKEYWSHISLWRTRFSKRGVGGMLYTGPYLYGFLLVLNGLRYSLSVSLCIKGKPVPHYPLPPPWEKAETAEGYWSSEKVQPS